MLVVVLASKSPRRREILSFAGIPFFVRPADILEIRAPNESAIDYVKRLALDKARAIETVAPDEVILSADTTVVVDNPIGDLHHDELILEKPTDSADARRMIELLSGRSHRVLTGICLRNRTREIVDFASTTVRFAQLTPLEVDQFIATGESMDKAGGYAIQGQAAKFVESIDGCYFNVMGLPISLVYRHLKRFQ
jgi:septum formation protein